MRRDSIDAVVGGPYKSSRQQAMEERRKQSLIENAIVHSEKLRKIEHERVEQRAWKKVLFGIWCTLDRRLSELEDQRDANRPHTFSDGWNSEFCEAVREIPEVRRACEDVWYAYINIDRPEFSEYV